MRKQKAEGSRQRAVGGRKQKTARCFLPSAFRLPPSLRCANGFTLIELIITLTVLTILTMGVIPLIKVSVKRQREQRLRDDLRMMRMAIDQFHREAVAGVQVQTGTPPPPPDPRIRVMITDNTIFGVSNPDRYPPDLETLVNGVSVTPLAASGGGKIVGKKKIYLREIPVDPMTGERDWEIRSTYDSKDAGSWGSENVFDVRSKSSATALNGEKYSDW